MTFHCRQLIGTLGKIEFPPRAAGTRPSQVKYLSTVRAERDCKSRNVRKSMVLNSRSMAGGPQILAPKERYAASSFGTLEGCSANRSSGQANAARGTVRHSG